MKRFFTIILAAVLVAAACGKTEMVKPAGPEGREVRFTSSVSHYAVKATDTAFETNDQVGIFAGAPIGRDNALGTVQGSSILLETPIKWADGSMDPVEFVAYSPFVASAQKEYAFSVAASQASSSGYRKSDLLIARTVCAPKDEAVALAFRHALSKVEITIDNQVAGTTVSQVVLEGVALSATVNLGTGAITNLGVQDQAIVANKESGSSFRLLLVPQTAKPKLRVVLSTEEECSFELDQAFAFQQGKKAKAELVLKDNVLKAHFAFTVTDWEDSGSVVDYGEPDSYTAGNSWSVIMGPDWSQDIPMALTPEGLWEADIVYPEGGEFKLRANNAWDLSAGMKENWTVYGIGSFEDAYLEQNSSNNIRLPQAGTYHLSFAYPSYRFIVTEKSAE